MARRPAAWNRPISVAILLAMLGLSLWHLHVLNRWMSRRSDLIAPLTGAQAALSGGDPYSETTTEEIERRFYGHVLLPTDDADRQAFAYPIYVVFLLAPLAHLPWAVAKTLFILAGIVGLGGSVWLWLHMASIPVSRRHAFFLTAAVLVSWPALVAFRHQQLTLLVIAAAVAGCYLLRRRMDAAAGAAIAITLIKPQFALLLAAWLVFWTVGKRRWRFPVSLAGVLCALLAGSWLLQPGWVAEWVRGASAYVGYTHSQPSLEAIFGRPAGIAGLAAVAAVCLWALWQLRSVNDGPRFGMAVSLALALPVVLSPTSVHWIYNQVLLMPACLILIHCSTAHPRLETVRRLTFAMIVWGYISVAIAVAGESLFRPSELWDFLPYLNSLLPVLVSCTLAIQIVVQCAEEETLPAPGSEPAVVAENYTAATI